MKTILLLLLTFLVTLSPAAAEPLPENDIPMRYTAYHVAYDVNADGSYVETQEFRAVILKENTVEKFKEAGVTFSTSIAKGEILEAYTLKKGGKRVEVPKSSYQVITNDGYENGKPLYSDETTIKVIFPDLAVGDSIVFSSRVTNSEGIFPNHFSVAHGFSRFLAYDDVSIRVSAPKVLQLRHEAYFLKEKPALEKGGKLTLEWAYQNRSPEKWTPAENGITMIGEEPSLYVSTFDSYRQIAALYGARAVPKAAVSERVKALATQIVTAGDPPAAQARSLYNWVAKNISYGGNCIGIGAVVPRDLGVILDNKMGDCKDHATLLQALLAARNIEAEQALVNAGAQYFLPATPIVSAVDHVINYIPSLQLFLDATAAEVPFGMVPVQLGEKPVLLVSNYREGLKIPSTAAYGHEQTMKTVIRVNADGTASGSSRISLKGMPAVQLRSVMRNLPVSQEDLAARKLLEGQGFHGSATLKKDDPTELLDAYTLSVDFKLDDLLAIASTTGMVIRPIVSSIIPIASFLGGAYEPPEKKPTICLGGRSIEEFVYEFPEGLKMVAVPKDFELATPAIHYTATYKQAGNSLTIRRELHDRTATNICSAAFMEGYKKAARSVVQDLKSQVLLTN